MIMQHDTLSLSDEPWQQKNLYETYIDFFILLVWKEYMTSKDS